MRRWRKGWVPVIAAVVVIAVAAFFLLRHPPRYEFKLADGSILRVEKIFYGKRAPFEPHGNGWQRLKASVISHLPSKWADRFGKPEVFTPAWMRGRGADTNFTGVFVWFTRVNPGSNTLQYVDVQAAAIVDEDGCVYSSVGSGGETATPPVVTVGTGPTPVVSTPGAATVVTTPATPPTSTVTRITWTGPPRSTANWVAFEAFPRYDAMLRVTVYDSGRKVLGEFNLPNPAKLAYHAPPKWMPIKMPATNREGEVSFTLTGIDSKSKSGETQPYPRSFVAPTISGPMIVPKFEMRERGNRVETWLPVEILLVGASGNVAEQLDATTFSLCPREPAWKFTVKFVGAQLDPSAPNELWTLKELAIPADGVEKRVEQDHKFRSVNLRVLSLVGAGAYTNVVDTPGETVGGDSSTPLPILRNSRTNFVRSPSPHVALRVDGLTADQRLSLRVIDDQKRETFGREIAASTSWTAQRSRDISYIQRSPQSADVYVTFNLAEDAKTIDLVFCVHATRKEEFIIEPLQIKTK